MQYVKVSSGLVNQLQAFAIAKSIPTVLQQKLRANIRACFYHYGNISQTRASNVRYAAERALLR